MTVPSPAFAAGLLTAHERVCPVASCQAQPGEACTTPMMVRQLDKTLPPLPLVLTGPHFERVLPDWVDKIGDLDP